MFQNIPELFEYNPLTGIVTYKPRYPADTVRQKQWNTDYAFNPAGFVTDHGYIRIYVQHGKFIYAHQVAFIIMTGKCPREIDHIDLVKTNNVWTNLREASHFENTSNAKQRYNNKSGFKGVSWSKSNNCWRMDITAKRIKYHSYHSTAELAYEAYCIKSAELHGVFGNVE